MRRITYVLLIAVFLALCFPLPHKPVEAAPTFPMYVMWNAAEPPQPLHAGTQDDPWPAPNRDTLKLVFDNSYDQYQMTAVEAELYDAAGTLVKTFTVEGATHFPKDQPDWSFPVFIHVEPLPNMALYRWRVRVEESNGNQSPWSADCWFRKVFINLEPPGGCALLR